MPRPLAGPGDECISDLRQVPHKLIAHSDDTDLQTVYSWLMRHNLRTLLTGAVDDAVQYVLDGARTGRFDLNSPDVDSDERRTVGTKLQYRVLSALSLVKERPLDTTIEGVPVDIKGTVRSNWTIPREAQCEICLLIQVDAANDRHRAFLMRTHRRWLGEGNNQDGKKGILVQARRAYALPVLDWTPLPKNPLKLLTEQQVAVVFDPHVGIKRRVAAMFGFLPEVIIPRASIETVGANAKDPVRRARQAKPGVFEEHGLVVLVGTWVEQRQLAARYGFDIRGDAWVAIRPETLGGDFEAAKTLMLRTGS
ncbi:NaeI family type II restriction endonuclease [Mycolicibacterium sp. lyk4-40-TYG-92]|uniref:NaeI family type II restriction endonuclease n=1 Tax=Mycolicibacterium sp. lyk4-40-TYG-92 TaxID=3040295 RepID=UPI0025508651|nr:NaeI family type II restriction endonuclease [Mycolicibacterium sp. lyk4-40-TYG-92]